MWIQNAKVVIDDYSKMENHCGPTFLACESSLITIEAINKYHFLEPWVTIEGGVIAFDWGEFGYLEIDEDGSYNWKYSDLVFRLMCKPQFDQKRHLQLCKSV